MADTDKREQYQTRYLPATVDSSNDGSGTPEEVLSTVMEDEGLLTTIRIFATEEQSYRIEEVLLNNDGTEDTANQKIELHGSSQYVFGDFENPAAEFGGQTKISVKLTSNASGQAGVNIRVDERVG
ncbi:MAG: hypothetical protein J07AB43_01530 [Candidatus Nanosalina sp. J07AB43]|jgi:hypothetical protein|nr:MAG: hypothetical protein J07AB43_01530 [Candidatus Nanosalina sp. J07AB43]